MKNKILILLVILFSIFIWSCDEEPLVGPEIPTQEAALEKVTIGTVTPILSLDHGNSPEGIAFDKRGNMYISNTRGPDRSINEILKVNLDGSYTVYATLPGAGHATGVVTDRRGYVYVAFRTSNPTTRGVYRIAHNGTLKRLKGSQNMVGPNALTFDWLGNLYATDSDGYSVWKYGRDRTFSKWLEDPLLVGGIVPGGPPFPLPGCNGIAFFPPNKLYVANTAQNSISRIIIGHKGKAASIELIKQDFLLMNVDGLAVDIYENIYSVLPPSTLAEIGAPPLPPVVMLNPNTGVVTPIVPPNGASDFNTPTSLAFGTRISNRLSLFVANAALQYGQPMDSWANPGVVQVFVGEFGLPIR